MDLKAEQLKLEDEAYNLATIKADNIFYKAIESERGHETNEGIILVKNVLSDVSLKISEYLNSKAIRGRNYAVRELVMDYKDDEESLAYLVVSSIISKLLDITTSYGPYTVPLTSVARAIVRAIRIEYQLDKFENKAPRLDAYIDKKYKKLSVRRRVQKKLMLGKKKLELDSDNLQDYAVQLGAILIDLVIKSGCDLIQYKSIKVSKNNTKSVIQFTPRAVAILDKMRETAPLFVYAHPICVVPPKEWDGFDGTGGLYKYYVKAPLVKIYADKRNRAMVKGYFESYPATMERFINIVNAVQRVPWTVNVKVLDVMKEIYTHRHLDYDKEFYLLGGLPDYDLPAPTELVPPVEYDDSKKEEYADYKNKLSEVEDRINKVRSKLIATKLATSTARKYSKYERIYFSYQVDFRGRLYPIQPYLNPQSSKHIKALLMFADGKPLDSDEAVMWWKIHGANCFGYDKELYPDRVRLIDEMHEDILAIAEDPIGNRKWAEADEPFLFLAWCFEYLEWVKDKENFLSRIPIALDATCSGIQIYSGLMLDNKGAEAVNVVNHNGNTKIADIYGDVAKCVNRYLETRDYDRYLEFTLSDGTQQVIDVEPIANSMVGKIDRKITKRNVMTFPYNVSTYGMKEQLMEDVLNEYEGTPKQFWIGEKWVVANFLSKLNYRGIGEVVKGAVECRDFLKSLTKDVIDKGNHIFYTTPIFKFPVVHRIVKFETHRVQTALARLTLRTPTTVLDTRKMVNGIAPNYIHSLDATLMFRTVERLLQRGVTSFALIHDSFGTHASDTAKLAEEVRKSYIEIFEDEPLLDFVKQVAPFRVGDVKEVIIGDLNLEEVMESDYIFS